MSIIAPSLPGTGVQAPFTEFTAGISEHFPRVARNRLLETSIDSKEKIDILPINQTSDRLLTGSYLEFRIPGIPGRFLDLSQLWLDIKLKITKNMNQVLEDEDHAAILEGISNTLFKTVQVFIGDKLVESNPFYSYTSYIRMLTSFNPEDCMKLGHNAGLMNEVPIPNEFTAAHFQNQPARINTDRQLLRSHGRRYYFPLLLDTCTLDQYLIDNIPVRLRLEFHSSAWLIQSEQNDRTYNLNILDSALWIHRIIPQQNALLAMNKSLINPITYTFNRTLFKSYILAANQTSLICEQPWNNIIPEKLYLIIVDLDSYAGTLRKNPLYFHHSNLSSIQVQVNGFNINPISANFTNEDYAHLYGETLKAVGVTEKHMLTYDTFNAGRTLFCFDFNNEKLDGVLPLEKSGNLRITLTLSVGVAYNRVIMLFGDTLGLIDIHNDRTVSCDVRA